MHACLKTDLRARKETRSLWAVTVELKGPVLSC